MEQKRNRSEVTMQIETNHMRDIKRQRMQKEMMRENDALERKVELEQKAASAKTKKIVFALHCDPEIPNVLYGDYFRIKQVLLNLLSNAVKYTHKGRIDFMIEMPMRTKNFLEINFRVKDTGIGIRKDEINRVVKPFERLGEKEQRDRRNRTGNEYRR